ncbi:MAG: hypothetical protein LUD41_05310 [Phascolarctobacterium sp.]|nr:hypothetical protein [Phascolarctobacterium sp.]
MRERLLEEEYAPTTINLYICAANRFVEYCGRRELQLVGDLPRDNLEQPELSRAEYLKLLVAARRLNRHRDYLLIKLFATTGIALSEVVKLTTLAVRQGKLDVCQNRIHKSMPIPSGLQTELLDYARAEGRVAGPIFITKNGNLLNRSSIRNSIATLAEPAGLPREKCNPSCLRKLYQTTQQEIEDSFAELVKRTFNDMIDKEQILIG